MNDETCKRIRSLVAAIQKSVRNTDQLVELGQLVRKKRISQRSWETAPDPTLVQDAVEALKAVLEYQDPWGSPGWAATILGSMGPAARRAAGTIIRMLKEDDDRSNHLSYVEALARIVNPRDPTMSRETVWRAVEALVRVLEATTWGDRRYYKLKARKAAAETLWRYGEVSIDFLRNALDDAEQDDSVRVRIAFSLWRATHPHRDVWGEEHEYAFRQILESVRHGTPRLQRLAVRWLDRMGLAAVGRARHLLAGTLLEAKDDGLHQEIQSTFTNHNLSLPDAIADLIRRSLRQDGRIPWRVEHIVQQRLGERGVRCSIIEALGIVGHPASAALPVLGSVAEDESEDPRLRELARTALARIGGGNAES